jgi:hypothetical protein
MMNKDFQTENSSELLLHLYHSMVRVTYSTSYYSDEVWLRKMMQLRTFHGKWCAGSSEFLVFGLDISWLGFGYLRHSGFASGGILKYRRGKTSTQSFIF